MIRRVTLKYFKRFEAQTFDLADNIVLAGPNDSGKTTLLQAIAVWDLALRKWLARRAGTKAKQRTGVPITRKDFTAIPLREMSLLWSNTSTNLTKEDAEEGQKPGAPRAMSIALEGDSGAERWRLTFEFTYQSSEQVYARPTAQHIEQLPKAAQDFQVVHVPPFSGIGAEETRYDRPYQDLLIGQGKAGDIVRNLLLEVYEKHRKDGDDGWLHLCSEVESIFEYRLLSRPNTRGGLSFFASICQVSQRARAKRACRHSTSLVPEAAFIRCFSFWGFSMLARPRSCSWMNRTRTFM